MNPGIDKLIAKHLSGNTESPEKLRLDAWLAGSEENRAYFEHAQKLWRSAENLKLNNDADLDFAWTDLNQRIQSGQVIQAPGRIIRWRIAAAVSGVVLTASLIGYFATGEDPTKFSTQVASRADTVKAAASADVADLIIPDTFEMPKPAPAQQVNRTGRAKNSTLIAVSSQDSAMMFSLPDGTMVFLNKNSKLTYPENFASGHRQVHLSGEAYFEVAHNQGEFLVFCQDVRARVLGTAFNVRGYEPVKKVDVMVTEGLVEVKAIDRAIVEPVVLKPGEQGSYLAGQVAITKSKASKKDRWWKRGGFRTKVKEFFNRITKGQKHKTPKPL
jgi:transmembrane sensor